METGATHTENGRLSEEAFARLEERLLTLAVPAAPPRYPSAGTDVGVRLLDAALNQDHIVRRAERLTIADDTHLVRDISVRVSLDRLTPTQREAGLRYGQLKERADNVDVPLAFELQGRDGSTNGDRAPAGRKRRRKTAEITAGTHGARSGGPGAVSPLIWVPVTKLPRARSAPVRLYDNEGREVPRATQPELLPVVNAAMYSLLKMVLRAEVDAQMRGKRLYEVLHETHRARWLIEQAIASLIYGHPREPRASATGSRRGGSESRFEADARDAALWVCDRYIRGQTALLELLHHASTEHVIVAGLLASKKEHYLSYEAPALPALSTGGPRERWLRVLRSLAPRGRQFSFSYSTHLPPSLDSFHVQVEAAPGVRVREALLVTDAEVARVGQLIRRLEVFAKLPAPATNAFAAYEIDKTVTDLEALVVSRIHDGLVYRERWERRHDRGGDLPPLRWGASGVALDDAHAELQALGAHVHAPVHAPAGTPPPRAGGAALEHAAETLGELQIGRELVMDDDPRGNVAHMYRRQDLSVPRSSRPQTSAASVHVTLTDEPSNVVGSVPSWLGALLLLVVFLGLTLFGSPAFLWPWSRAGVRLEGEPQIDAVVAVLLIVPTLILGRLDLPRGRTLTGRLRILDRWAAFVAVALTGVLAVVVATQLEWSWAVRTTFQWAVAVLAVLLLVTSVDLYVSRRNADLPSTRSLAVPAWLRPDPAHASPTYDAEFHADGFDPSAGDSEGDSGTGAAVDHGRDRAGGDHAGEPGRQEVRSG